MTDSALRHPLRMLLPLLCALALAACSSPGAVATFREADDPTADTLADWTAVAPGLHVSWGSVDVRYPRSVAPQADSACCRLTAWRAARVPPPPPLSTADSIRAVPCPLCHCRSAGASRPAALSRIPLVHSG